MAAERFFCALESQAHGEAMFGTVARIRSWLLLEYPNVWRRNAVADSRLLSPELKGHIRRLPIDRTVFIRREHHRSHPLHCFFVSSSEESPFARRHLIGDYDELRRLDGVVGEPQDDLLFATCTHGRHDRCCAKFGIPVWCAFRDVAGPRAWQISHVGGDRFAGNVVVFPYGIYYGRVRPDDVPEVVRRSEAGEVWLPGYRGRCCFPRPVQVAEYFVRAESGRLQINEFLLKKADRFDDVTQVTFVSRTDKTHHTVEFVTRRGLIRQRLTCDALEESDVAQYEVRKYTAGPR